jgi:hypothetical protein
MTPDQIRGVDGVYAPADEQLLPGFAQPLRHIFPDETAHAAEAR